MSLPSGGSPEKSSNSDGNNPFRFLYHHQHQQQHKPQQKQSNDVPPDIVTGTTRLDESVAVPQPLLPRIAPPMKATVGDGNNRNKPLQVHLQSSCGTFWNGLGRVVKVSCISASMLFAPCSLQSLFNLSSSPSPSSSSSTPPVTACISQTTHPQKLQQQQTQSNSPLLVRLDEPSDRALQRHAAITGDSDTSNDKNTRSENKMTNAAMIMHELSCRTGAAANAATASATVSSASTGQASDVEVAAMTLGAVTLGGIIMRTLLTVSRDQKAERDRLAKECARLQDEEENRALRLERTRLETAGLSSRPDSDEDQNQLMSALRQRVQNMEESGDDDDDDNANDGSVSGKQNDDRKKNKKKKNQDMRQSPIPDRGMGSAVLERPDGNANDENNNKNDNEDDSEQDNDNPPGGETLAQPDQAEMLKRMWNLSPPDKE